MGKILELKDVSKIYGDCFDPTILSDATKETDLDLIMDRRAAEHRKKLYEIKKTSRTNHRSYIER